MTRPDAVTDDCLHFGTDPTDPTGVTDCEACGGRGPESATCESCGARQQLRDAWWNSSTGPARLGLPTLPARRYLDDESDPA